MIAGQVASVNAGAQTFTVRVNDRKAYEFKPAPEHKVDLAHVKET